MSDLERQIKREADAIQDGVQRFAESRKYRLATDSKAAKDLVGIVLGPLTDAIRAIQQDLLKPSQSQRMPNWAIALLAVDAAKLALIAISVLLNAITRSEFEEGVAPGVTAVRYEIGQRCRFEMIYDRLRRRRVDVARHLLTRNQSRNAAKRANELAEKLDDPDDWVKNFRSFHLGEELISVAVDRCYFEGQPIFVLKTVREGSGKRTKTTQRIELSAAASDWICNHPAALADLPSPVYRAMIMPPRPWTSLAGGGYVLTPLGLLKRQPNSWAQQLHENANWAPVLSAVNAMQMTAYRINKDTDGVMGEAWNAGNLYFGLKTHSFEHLPPRLPDDADPKEIKERKQDRSDTFHLNNRIKGLRKIMAFRLSESGQLILEPRFYFPYQLDHRGRAYPVPQLLNPQSDDIGRSLLEFADGKRLGERGAYWLAIHLANCYWKGNKVSFEELQAWVHKHDEEIIAFAANPLHAHRFWDEAKKPWMLMVACREWKRYLEQGPDLISHLPISMDGSCNGYQHLSAMGLDPFGGHATNLVPGNAPQDIYQRVCDRVNRRIQKDAEDDTCSDQDAARQLLVLGWIDRDDVKHATMTTPYGVSRGTIYKVLLDSKPAKDCRDPKKCAEYLSIVLEECIPEVAIEAGKVMTWLRELAYILAKANRGMAWTAPTGLNVVHANREPKKTRVKSADGTFTVHIEDETQKIDVRKQVDGIVAHLVHSYDASHMMRTTNRLHDLGLRHFAMVHDSYGVHACDVDLLHRVLREEFAGIYSEPVLQNFLNELRAANPDLDLPDVPPIGNLDIRQVLASPYFFA